MLLPWVLPADGHVWIPLLLSLLCSVNAFIQFVCRLSFNAICKSKFAIYSAYKYCVLSDSNEVFVHDMRQRLCSNVFVDDGCTQGTSIAISPGDQYLATGYELFHVDMSLLTVLQYHCVDKYVIIFV